MGKLAIVLTCCALCASSSRGAVWEEDFAAYDPAAYHVEGDAYWDRVEGTLVLTEAAYGARGRIYLDKLVRAEVWSVAFDLVTGGGTGADGLTFAFVEDCRHLASAGGWLDFDGAEGYAVEFDTWYNRGWDPTSSNHVAILQGSAETHLAHACLNVEDSQWHHVTVDFDRGHIVVMVDGIEYIDFDIPGFQSFSGYFGFTAATGAASNWHIIDNIRLTYEPDVSGCVELAGAPLAGRKVILKQKSLAKQTWKTNYQGCYDFSGLEFGKPFRILVRGPVVRSPVADLSGCAQVTGRPLKRARVVLRQIGEPKQKTSTDENGCFAFPSVVYGKRFKLMIRGRVAP